jgi:hypothetical protein
MRFQCIAKGQGPGDLWWFTLRHLHGAQQLVLTDPNSAAYALGGVYALTFHFTGLTQPVPTDPATSFEPAPTIDCAATPTPIVEPVINSVECEVPTAEPSASPTPTCTPTALP